jgi:hypothetical protein
MTTHRNRLDTAARRPDVALRPFRTPVRGHPFAARPPGADAPHAGQRAQLEREPGNPADPLAVAVWTEGPSSWWRVGYLDRGVAARLAPRIDQGLTVEARLDGWVAEPRGRWRRPVVLLLPDGADGASPGRSATPATTASAASTLAAEPRPSTRLWGRPPGVVVRPVRDARRR